MSEINPLKTLILFDIDGTLSKSRGLISQETKNELIRLKHKNYALATVGGSDLAKQIEQLGWEFMTDTFDYLFPENGLVAYQNSQKFFEQSLISFLGEKKYLFSCKNARPLLRRGYLFSCKNARLF